MMNLRSDRAALFAACAAAEATYRRLEARFNKTQDAGLIPQMLRAHERWRAARARLDAVPAPFAIEATRHHERIALEA